MSEESPLVSAESAALEREWERQGRKVTQVCDANYERHKERLKFVNRAALDQVAKALEILPCPACMVDKEADPHQPSFGVECTRLVVTMEPHPMQDTGSIVNAVCHHCGHQQMWPFKEKKNTIGAAFGASMLTTATQVAIQRRNAFLQMEQLQAAAGLGSKKAIEKLSEMMDIMGGGQMTVDSSPGLVDAIRASDLKFRDVYNDPTPAPQMIKKP